MCQISDYLKLCSCNDVNLANGNYWEISRRKEGALKVGQNIYPSNELKIEQYDINKILNKLNENSLFDFDFEPQEDDKLEVHFHFNKKEAKYFFIFNKDKWKQYFISNTIELLDEMEFGLPPYITQCKGEIEKPFNKD